MGAEEEGRERGWEGRRKGGGKGEREEGAVGRRGEEETLGEVEGQRDRREGRRELLLLREQRERGRGGRKYGERGVMGKR